jgi:dihydroorotase-like cyclic amidohydrolase
VFCWAQGGTVVNHDGQFQAEVLVQGGVIQAVGANLAVGILCSAKHKWTPQILFRVPKTLLTR